MHYYDRYHVLLGRAYGNCNKSRHHRTAFSKVEATDSFPVPKSSGQSPCCHPTSPRISLLNILGLGWAATPAGLNAMEELKNLEDDRRKYHLPGKVRAPGTASNEMCTFLIINISSLQLIPVNVIAYRSQYGSINPAAIVGPGILATAVSTLVAMIYCKCKEKPDAGH